MATRRTSDRDTTYSECIGLPSQVVGLGLDVDNGIEALGVTGVGVGNVVLISFLFCLTTKPQASIAYYYSKAQVRSSGLGL